jgi:hypothetical protein
VCTDNDSDGYGDGPGCQGPDCDDDDENNWTSCDTCGDSDGDGHYGNCDAYVSIVGPDCDDGDENNWTSCDTCGDSDGDGHHGNCDAYVSIVGPDCDDNDENNWVSCASCRDADGDDWYGGGCDAYISINGPDCNESDNTCWEGDCCLRCTDMDGDGYGTGDDCIGPDCDDDDANNWVSCAGCTDDDSDSHYVGCDAYVTIDGPDCDDNDENNWVSCATCTDADSDGSYVGCDAYVTIGGPDCDDDDENNWVSCATCRDADSDGSFTGCDAYVSIVGPDCDDSDFASHPGAAEVCDGNDNACTGTIPTNETDDDSDGWVECAGWNDTQGDNPGISGGGDCDDNDANNWVSCATCKDADSDNWHAGCDAYVTIDGPDCDDDDSASYPGATEVCDGNDNACTGTIPANETDDDSDNYVECSPFNDTQGDNPGISGGDCNDGAIAVHPGAAEDCTDGIDNNCDGLTDLEDAASCPPISVIINKWGPQPRPVSHGRTTWIQANFTPDDPNAAAPWAWARLWEVIDAQPAAACAVSDVTLHDQSEWRNGSQIQADMPNLLAKKDCVYTVRITVNSYATDTIDVQMINRPPEINNVSSAVFDGTAWRLHVAAGTHLSITAGAWDQDGDNPLNFDWTGPDVGELSCDPACQSSDGSSPYQTTVDWGNPTSPGTYNLTVLAWDDFDPTNSTSVDIIVEVDACVWVEAGGSGTGTLGDPLGSIDTALNQAKNSADTSVCVIGAGTFTEDLNLPSSPNTPDLLGGFDPSGSLSTDRPIIIASIASGLRFQAGHAGRIHHFAIQQSVSGNNTVSVVNASPEISDCHITLADGNSPVGVYIHAGVAMAGTAAPTILGGQIVSDFAGSAQDSTGILVVVDVGATASPRILHMNRLQISACTGTCRGIHLTEGTWAEIRGNQGIRVNSEDDTAIAIDLEGTDTRRVGALIDGNQNISAETSKGQRSIAVNLRRTDRTSITNNDAVGTPWTSAGRALSAGIADGYVLRDGTTAAGESNLLTISGNQMIAGGSSWWAQPCQNPGDTGEGADVAVGILLVGSQNATIRDNGRPNEQMSGIFGGGTTIHWVPLKRRLPPSAIGLWLIDTQNVTVLSNEIRAGSYQNFTKQGCANPDIPSDPSPELPPATAYRDGLPPNDDFLLGPVPGELPSRGTVFDKNGASCAQQPENGAMGAGVVTWCAVVELNIPTGATAPYLTNNHLAATKGNFLIALWQRGGSGVLAVNNTLDSDQMLKPWDPPPDHNSINKWPVFADNIDPDGLTLINNIIYSHEDDPYDRVSERLCITEWVATGTSSNIAELSSNLFYIQGDDLTDPNAPPYVRVTDHSVTTDYSPAALNAIAGIPTCAGNFADLPGLTEPGQDWEKSTARLIPGSAAIDAGMFSSTAPTDDIDLESRPDPGGGFDIGHDEYYP